MTDPKEIPDQSVEDRTIAPKWKAPIWVVLVLSFLLALTFFLPNTTREVTVAPGTVEWFVHIPFTHYWDAILSIQSWRDFASIGLFFLGDSFPYLFAIMVFLVAGTTLLSPKNGFRIFFGLFISNLIASLGLLIHLVSLFWNMMSLHQLFLGGALILIQLCGFYLILRFWKRKTPYPYLQILTRATCAGFLLLVKFSFGLQGAYYSFAGIPTMNQTAEIGFWISAITTFGLGAIFVRQAWDERPIQLPEPEPVQ